MHPLPSIQLKRGQITDLTYNDFAEVTYGRTFSETQALATFEEMERALFDTAARESVHHVRVNYPSSWSVFDHLLEQREFTHALNHLQLTGYPPGSFVRSLKEIRDIRLVRDLLDQQQALHHTYNSDFFQDASNFDADAYLADIQRTIDTDQGTAYGFFDKDRLVGFISVELQENNSLYVVELYVDSTFRGKSLGRMLMQAAFHYARLKNCISVTTSLAIQNQGGRAFYEKLGFSLEWKTRYKNV